MQHGVLGEEQAHALLELRRVLQQLSQYSLLVIH
jgi:hypothetical protein